MIIINEWVNFIDLPLEVYVGERQANSHIHSLQALRALACIAVMLSHSAFISSSGINFVDGFGKWGVSVFLVLSGFVLMYSYYGKKRIEKASVFDNIKFAWKKIRGIYPLHIITTMAFVVFMFLGDHKTPVLPAVCRIVLNMLLLQEWIPFTERSINGVAWYLCVSAFCYFVFPWILLFYEKRKRRSPIMGIFVLFFLQIVIGFIGGLLPNQSLSDSLFWGSDMTEWLVYKHPISRSLDFLIGCNIGYIYANEKQGIKHSYMCRIMSAVAVCLSIIGIVIYVINTPASVQGKIDSFVHTERWWTYVLLFIPSACLFVYIFAHNEWRLSAMFTNKLTIYLGDISKYLFLIHYVVFYYISAVIIYIFGNGFDHIYGPWLKICFGIIISIVLSHIWNRLTLVTDKF